MLYSGHARVLQDDINTDYIISSRRKRDTLDEHILCKYFMEDLDPNFAATVQKNDILVAGYNFGCGSAMEIAALVIKALGVSVVVARSFARSFYRNGINNGLLLVQCDTTSIEAGDLLQVSLNEDGITLHCHQKDILLHAPALAPIQTAILQAGGLVPYVKQGI